MAQQQCLRAEGLLTHRAVEFRQLVLRQVGVPSLCRLENLVALAAGEAALVQVDLFVVGQAGQVVESLVTVLTAVERTRPVAALVRQQLGFGFKDEAALEAGVRPDWAGLHGTGLLGGVGRRQRRAAGPVAAQVPDHLRMHATVDSI